MKKKTILLLLICNFLMIHLLPIYSYAMENIADIDATSITVGDYDELVQAINNNPYAHIELKNNIEIKKNMEPMATFGGTLDGRGYSIKNVNNSMFKSIEHAIIRNLVLDNVMMKVNYHTTDDKAPLAETVKDSYISNVHITSGYVEQTSTTSTTGTIGGLVGKVIGGTTIEKSSVNLNIQGQTMGGLAGSISGDGNILENNMVLGVMETATVSVKKAGGVSATISGDTILRNSYTKIEYNNSDGKFYGIADFDGNGLVENVLSMSNIPSNNSEKFTAKKSNVTFTNCRVFEDTKGGFSAVQGITSDYSYHSADLSFFTETLNWDFANIWRMNGLTPILKDMDMNLIQIDSTILIKTFEEFTQAISKDSKAKIVLAADLDGNKNTTISSTFSGEIIGNGYKISNLTNPLFKELSGAKVTSLVITDAKIANSSTGSGIGILANKVVNSSVIDDVHVVDSVLSSVGKAGLIAGIVENSTIKRSSARGEITGDYVGLMAGRMLGGKIEDSYAIGTIPKQVRSTERVGGLVGNPASNAKINNVYTKVDINTKKNTGGLIGMVYSDAGSNITVTNSLSLSNVNNSGKKFSFTTPQDRWSNNYQLDSTTGVNNASPIITITKNSIEDASFYEKQLKWNVSSTWSVEEVSLDSPPTLKNSDPYYEIKTLENPLVDPVIANQTLISGSVNSGKPGQRVTATVLGEIIGEGTLAKDSSFKFAIEPQFENTAIEVTVYDNVKSKSTTTYVRAGVPLVPQVEAIIDTDTMVSGYTSPNVLVKMTNSSGKVLDSTIANSQGAFLLEIEKQPAGTTLIFTAENDVGKSNEQRVIVQKSLYSAPLLDSDINAVATSASGYGAEPGSTVIMKRSNHVLAETIADQSGHFIFEFPAQLVETELTIYYITEQAKSIDLITTVIDAPPEAPIIYTVTDRDTILSGETARNTTVEVRNEENELLGQSISNQEGNFSITIPLQVAGTKLIVTPSNKFGVGDSSMVIVELTAPDNLVVDPITTRDTVVTGQGKIGATVNILVDGHQIGQGVVDLDGEFSVNIPQQVFGTTVEVYLENEKGTSRSVYVEVGLVPPEAPIVDEVFDDMEIITGTGEPGAEVTVRIGSRVIGSDVVNEQGQFAVAIPLQSAGIILSVFLKNQIGNSDSVEVEVQLTPPLAPEVDDYYEDSTAITGSGKPGSSVFIEAGGEIVATGNINVTGTFSIPLSNYKVGENIRVYLENVKGTSPVTEVLVQLSPPGAPTVAPIKENTTILTGKGKETTVVLVYKGEELIGEGKTTESGDFTVSIPGQPYKEELSVMLVNDAGASPKTIVIVGMVAPDAPLINAVTDNDTVLSGIGKIDSEIIAYANNRQIGRGKVQDDGSFILNIASQKVGTVISVVNSNIYGSSDATDTIVTLGIPGTPQIDEITDEDTIIQGKGKSGATMVIAANGIEISRVIVSDDNSFSAEIEALNADDVVSIYQLNSMGESERVSTIVQLTAPKKPIVDRVTDQSVAVTGLGTPHATVYVKLDDETVLGTGTVDKNGDFIINIPQQPAYTILMVTLENAAGISPFKVVLVSKTGQGSLVNMDSTNTDETNLPTTGTIATTQSSSHITANGAEQSNISSEMQSKQTAKLDDVLASGRDTVSEENSLIEELLPENEPLSNSVNSKEGIAGLDELNEITAPVIAAAFSAGMTLILLVILAFQRWYLGKRFSLKDIVNRRS